MSDRRIRWSGAGLAPTAIAGFLALTAVTNPAVATADGEDIGLVIGARGLPIPGADYLAAADFQSLDIPYTQLYPDLAFYGARSTVPSDIGFSGPGVFTPEG